jgi:hypothetical protein
MPSFFITHPDCGIAPLATGNTLTNIPRTLIQITWDEQVDRHSVPGAWFMNEK